MATTTTSKMYSINWNDAGKGLIMAVGMAVATAITQAISTTPIVLDWKAIGIVGASAALVYLIKNFFTPSAEVKTPTPPPASGK